jgi:basic amino acid/polyamine antiporter, APA family
MSEELCMSPRPVPENPPRAKLWLESASATPQPSLRVRDAVALIVGIVIGAGIFVTPSMVASNSAGPGTLIFAWVLGGLVALIGALCYAELAATYPHTGGDYHYLTRAFGPNVGFLFGWARMTVIPTGSIALLAFAFGDYASQMVALGPHSSALYAAAIVILITGLNLMGIRHGTRAQNFLTALEVLGLVLVIVAGLWFAHAAASSVAPPAAGGSGASPAFGLAMVFVLLAYGGWNEAAYVSAEMRGSTRNIVLALLLSVAIVTVLYVLANAAYLAGLGFAGMTKSQAVAADLLRASFGERSAMLISVIVCISSLTSINATVIFGARSSYALGRDFAMFHALGRWHGSANTPNNALIVQAAISLALVFLGALTRKGFETMVEYTAPVFWSFFLLTGVALFVLRRREPHVEPAFRVPLYPLTPLLFCLSSAYLLYSSLAYTGIGALVGVAVLLVGALLLLWKRAPLRARARTSR